MTDVPAEVETFLAWLGNIMGIIVRQMGMIVKNKS